MSPAHSGFAAIELAARPDGAVRPEHFRLVRRTLAPPAAGQVLVRNLWLSLDPYMRGRMNAAKSYAPPAVLGEVMVGGTAGVVERSEHPQFQPGDTVIGALGWQEWGLADGAALVKVDATHVPLEAYLGAAGMPGITAWYGMTRICAPAAGQTVLISAAAGAVGGVAGQLARRAGARAVGIAGGAEKCAHVREVLGFDDCIDYKAAGADLPRVLQERVPQGVDCFYDNVGGSVLDAALESMNTNGRIALCGMIAGYDGEPTPIRNPWLLLSRRLRTEGFIISDHPGLWPAARAELAQWIADGQLRHHETVADGLARAPEAFIGMLQGRNLGKQLVRLG